MYTEILKMFKIKTFVGRNQVSKGKYLCPNKNGNFTFQYNSDKALTVDSLEYCKKIAKNIKTHNRFFVVREKDNKEVIVLILKFNSDRVLIEVERVEK